MITKAAPATALVLLLAGAFPAAAADKCLAGASTTADRVAIALIRGEMERQCPCRTFAGPRADWVKCVKGVLGDDGPIVASASLRPQCKSTALRMHKKSDCAFAAVENRRPCCEHTASGKSRARIRKAASCASSGSITREVCYGSDFAADACSGDATNSCRQKVVQTTVSIPSAAEPAETPGTTGVTVTNPKLLSQFGGGSFSLNDATYTRYALAAPAPVTPEAILILVPGFEGGAGDFKILAENLIVRARDQGLDLEVWGFDRRGHQLEDRAGLDLAEQYTSAQVALDWLFGGELGLSLHPVLAAGPNRRGVFYDSADVPFMGNWTNLVFSRDIDAVVAAADAVVLNHNVFLGGHSAGTGFTARYAATDFNLTGVGSPDPGYAKLRGLVLLEGGGGSTSGTAPTTDSLDRMEAAANGGMFYAVRDAAPRCADGTPCTLATEAADCALALPAKCTLPTAAFSQVPGLLNPRVLASVEPAAIQGALDPDGGQIILQVPQGGPTNTAVQQVADLAGLAFLPQATVLGGIGSFVDDDGAIAALATFVATSVGGPGPTVGGLLTWFDRTESGSFPPCPGAGCITPDNGPAPTALPAAVWGQEKEVTRFDRLLTTFYTGGTNFTDWYYPNAGPATTTALAACAQTNPLCAGVCVSGSCALGNVGASCSSASQCVQTTSLDSSALSVGRGRRDVESLTEAANVDIPVIAFGGSNGLARAPGSFVAFANSIGLCAAPSCTGTARVVDASMPNPAFPTFGDVAGGFEVYMAEGFAHVDVLTAEDDADNPVPGRLVDFLIRNAQ